MISINFEARGETLFGQHLRVVGNFHDLGDWDPSLGLELQTDITSAYPFWKSKKDIRVPEGCDLEFKLVVMNNELSVSNWESIPENRVYTSSIAREKVVLHLTINNSEVVESFTISAEEKDSQQRITLENYSKILTPYRIISYPILQKDQEFIDMQYTKIEEPLKQTEEEPQLLLDAASNGEDLASTADAISSDAVEEEEQPAVDQPAEAESNIQAEVEDLIAKNHNLKYNGRIGYFYRDSIESKSGTMECSSHQKATRLKNEIKQLAKNLPKSSSNSIILLFDETRLDVMRALIFGSEGTPYAHGAFIFDIYIPDEYPGCPPKVSIVSTNGNKIRFNPNLYSDGLVCLSLLGTWQGSAQESWDPSCSSIYQILVSIQSLVMNEDVYFNEPDLYDNKGSDHGDKCNEGYSNIVRYCNLSHTICDMIESPPPEFEQPILLHFYLKQDIIRADVKLWLAEAAKKHLSEYDDIVNYHNSHLSEVFSNDIDEYEKRLTKAALRLETLLEGLSNRINITA